MKKQGFSLLQSLVGDSWKHVALLHSLVLQSQFLLFVVSKYLNLNPREGCINLRTSKRGEDYQINASGAMPRFSNCRAYSK